MLTKTSLEYQPYEDVHVAITKNVYNSYYTPTYLFIDKCLESWYPKIHSPCNYFQRFYVAALIEYCGTENHFLPEKFRNYISKKTRSFYKVTIKNGTPLSSSDSEMASKIKKNRRATFEKVEDALLLS